MAHPLRRDDYTVGWVCALPVELAAAQEMLDKEHDTPPYDAHDSNLYTCGRVGEHNVVIACLPEGQTGTSSAAAVAMQMKSTFSSTRFGLMVGIGGGVPSEEDDVRLGDVVVSKPHKTHGGVVQYDSGKATASGFERTGALNTPPTVLLNAVANVRAKQMRGKSKLLEYLSKLDSLPDFTREAAGSDTLFEAGYRHAGKGATCAKCSTEHAVDREPRRQEVVVHHGTIASGNQVIKDAAVRDRLSAELGGVLCFEMEAAGLMNSFPCLVVRGVCDYADSHKNKRWQAYAAGTAAAYAKEVLSMIPPADVAKTHTVNETIREASDARQDLDSQRMPPAVDEGVTGGRLVYNKPKHDWSLDAGYALGRWLAAQCLEQDVLAMYANRDPNGRDPLVISADRFQHACRNGGIESSLSPRKEVQWRQEEAKEKVWEMLRTECSMDHLVFAIIAAAFALMDVHDEETWGPAAKKTFRSLAERELKSIPVQCGIDLRMLWIRITKTAKHDPEYLEGFVTKGASVKAGRSSG